MMNRCPPIQERGGELVRTHGDGGGASLLSVAGDPPNAFSMSVPCSSSSLSPRGTTVVLLTLLLLATSALGLSFGGGGIGGGTEGTPLPITEGTSTATADDGSGPSLVLDAGMVNAQIAHIGSGVFVGLNGRGPMVALKVTMTQIRTHLLSRTGRPLSYVAFTNDSGVAFISAPAGNYTIDAAGAVFNYGTTVGLVGNLTTRISLTVYPRFNVVSSMKIVNQGTLSQVEPSATIFLTVQGIFRSSYQAKYQLIGANPGEDGYSVVRCRAIGEYGAPGGLTVLMAPSGAYQSLPSEGIYVMHYETNSTVNYIGGH